MTQYQHLLKPPPERLTVTLPSVNYLVRSFIDILALRHITLPPNVDVGVNVMYMCLTMEILAAFASFFVPFDGDVGIAQCLKWRSENNRQRDAFRTIRPCSHSATNTTIILPRKFAASRLTLFPSFYSSTRMLASLLTSFPS